MAKEKGGFDIVKSGMEIVIGGFDPYPEPLDDDKRCICSPGGWSSGKASECGCSCGCVPGGSGSADNNRANSDKAGNCVYD
jgi:hypothetical protein